MDDEVQISQKIIKWFKEERGISLKTLMDTGVYSGRRVQNGDKSEVVPDLDGNLIVFPFYSSGEVVNEKYRTGDKRFSQSPGGKRVFWNEDVIDDETVQDGTNALVITEGEIDALSFVEAGYPYVISVPDGAPPPRNGAEQEDIDPERDDKFRFIYNAWDRLKTVRRIIIATDNDDPGKRLAEELVRRLGRVRCLFLSYPEGSKDANDVLRRHSGAFLFKMLREAQPYPISGIYTYTELPPEPTLTPISTGWGRLDPFIKLFYPAFMVVTGTAGSGKSTWVNQMVAQVAVLHGWSSAIASFEMRINPFVTDTFLAVHRDFEVREGQTEWLERNFIFISPEPGEDNENFDIDWLIERAEAAVIRHGIRILVIDPWNEVEHALRRGESLTDYAGRAIRALKRFGREFGVLVIVVAHPTKSGAAKPPEDISLYDVSDSAHFANKADLGVVLMRVAKEDKTPSFETNIMVKKVRYQPETGNLGKVFVTYSPTLKCFSQ